ncbi:MAG: hypothetical protein D6824_09270 [Planctomycetota bacterium]|nr:MAG: hypothetical protein D6824_09270 [Planctomycetota bacterium]
MLDLTPVTIVSYPKSGRTWLTVLLGKALCDALGLGDRELFELFKGPRQPRRARRRMPPMTFSHEGASFDAMLAPEQLRAGPPATDGRVVLLVRDPRDVLVSHYHQLVGRKRFADERDDRADTPAGQLTRQEFYDRAQLRTTADGLLLIDSFLDSPLFGVRKVVHFHRLWAEAVGRMGERAIVVRYEALHEAPLRELQRVLDLAGVDIVREEHLARAVEFARFENMRRLEAAGAFSSGTLQPRGRDSSAFKTRKGRVGGHLEELTPQQRARLDDAIASLGDPWYSSPAVSSAS